MSRGLAWLVPLLFLAGCGGLPGNVVVLMPDDDGHVGKIAVHGGSGEVDLNQALAASELGKTPGQAFVAKQRDVDETFAAAIAATPRKPSVFILYFRSEAAEIAPDSRPTLDAAIAAAKSEQVIDISVVGHTDAAGTGDYNLELSLRRARSIRKVLLEAGIPDNVIEVAYHGANNPLVPTPPSGHEPRNRRVEITIR